MGEAAIIHVNIVDYPAAIAQAHDPSLARRPFVVAAESGTRRIVLSPSQLARSEGIERGMSLASAQRQLPSLTVLSLDPRLIARTDEALSQIIDTYSPTIQGERGGHLYLDMRGTNRLFGPVIDSALRLRRQIRESVGLEAAVAVGSNKLVAKIGTRAVRPYGLAEIRDGEEAAFLSCQSVDLLNGVGAVTKNLLAAVGITEIGELARLSDEEVLAFLGTRGLALRDSARGLDSRPFEQRVSRRRAIRRSVDFNEPILALTAIKAAVVSAASDAALELRSEGLACATITITLCYSDTKESTASHSTAPLQWSSDNEIEEAAWRAAERALTRRVRLVGFHLTFSALTPSLYDGDLFASPAEGKLTAVQGAVDAIRQRYGSSSLLHASALAYGY